MTGLGRVRRGIADQVRSTFAAPPELPERRSFGAELLRATDVRIDLGGTPIVGGASVAVAAGELVALVGPNGAGKSTLLHALSGDLVPSGGTITLDGQPLSGWNDGDLALRRAVLPQQVTVSFPFTVEQVVRMGRAPWAGTVAEDDDAAIVDAALAAADVVHLLERTVPSLSGGERARVALARVLAQATQLLLLDEPTAALDLHHQELTLAQVRQRVRDGAGAVVVLHDLNQAATYADRIVVLADGRAAADGTPADVLRPDLLSDVYRHPIEVVVHPRTGGPLVLPRIGDSNH